MTSGFIFMKSVYDNDFRCKECGTKIFENGKPNGNLCLECDRHGNIIETENPDITNGLPLRYTKCFCNQGHFIGIMFETDRDLEGGGNWQDFIKQV